MASFVRRAMVYLGLYDDEEYDDYDQYEEPAPPVGGRGAPRSFAPAPVSSVQSFPAPAEEQAPSAIRALPREDPQAATAMAASRGAVVRPIVPSRGARVHVVAPERFGDAQEIGDRLKVDQPVIVNLQVADRELARRMIDFCSGVTYALGGSMDKVAEQVFLLTPSNVEVSPEERQRLQERGLYRP